MNKSKHLPNRQSATAIVLPPGTQLEPLLELKQAAYLLGISLKTLRGWIWKRKIEYVKSGARVMIRPQAIRDFVTNNTHQAAG